MEEIEFTRIDDIDKLSTCITDLSYQEGLTEIIEELKKIKIDTFAMNTWGEARLVGRKEMLKKIIAYLERCL